MSHTTITVPLDSSRFAEWALPVALRITGNLDAYLDLVSVHEDAPVSAGWPLTAEHVKEGFERYQEGVVRRIGDVSNAHVTASVIAGPVAKTLVEYVQRSAPDLVVMSTHGRGPLSRAWLGSVADRLVRYADMPVLLVRPDPNGEADLKAQPRFRHILVALDGSRRAEESLVWATRVGKPEGARYTLLNVVPAPHAVSPYLPHTIQETHRILDRGVEEGERYLADVAQGLREEGFSVTTEVIPGMAAAPGILRFADRAKADLTVIATHGHSGLTRIVMGSVADKVIRGAAGPVLVIRTVKSPAELSTDPVEVEEGVPFVHGAP